MECLVCVEELLLLVCSFPRCMDRRHLFKMRYLKHCFHYHFGWKWWQIPWSLIRYRPRYRILWRRVWGPVKIKMLKKIRNITYIFVHSHSNFFNGSRELIKVDSSFVHDVKVFELFTYELSIINIIWILLVNFIS